MVRMPELIPEMTGRLAKAKLAAIDTATTPATILLFLAGGIMMAMDYMMCLKSAGVLLVILPPVLLYLVMQRFFVESVERSGLVG